MKKLLITLCAMFFAFGFICPVYGAEGGETMYVNDDYVRERTGPSTDYEIVDLHFSGDEVTVVDYCDDWCQLSNGNYIYSYLLSFGDDSGEETISQEYHDDLIIVDISNQTVEYWYHGELVASGACVTGDLGSSPTPTGMYTVWYKNSDFDMNGNPGTHTQYATFFNGDIGCHDAPWRSEFGGDIYRSNGSHGCINMELYMAEFIYYQSRIGSTQVLVQP